VDTYNESELRAKVDAALLRIRTLLDNTRNPQYPADVPHKYDDKYHLVEYLGRVTIASLLQCLQNIGLSSEDLPRLRDAATTRAVTLRLKAEENCRFLREETRKVESAQEIVTETKKGSSKTTKIEKVVTNITEYFWSFSFKYELFAFVGNADDKGTPLLSRSGGLELKTTVKSTPRPQSVVRPAIDGNVTWLLQHLDKEERAAFTIDRASAECHTPRRNDEVEAAITALDEFSGWCEKVATYFGRDLFPVHQGHGLDLNAISPESIFIPVLPLFDGSASADGVVPVGFIPSFLAEQQKSLAAKCGELGRVFPRDASVITVTEASLLVIVMHAADLCQQFFNGVEYVEAMLRKQLIAAIGKEITAVDFSHYMDFHHRKLLRPGARPQPFSHAIRRPDHDPEGVLSLEAETDDSMADPIATTVAYSHAERPMSFALDASTRVQFLGDRYLHAWISHQFSGTNELALSLVARARQFSSFVLLVGRIASADVFEPKFGVIVQNKDLLKIPLMLEQIPTPKEFRDAIESLSPEQQRFAKAFRAMQLESTLFGVCIIQIKPQLEKLLRLEPDSLTKEIKLTQELLNLFIEYQIPSDLLSYDGPADAASEAKLARVKDYTARMLEMLNLSKQREIEEEQQREALRVAELNRTMQYQMPPSAPMMSAPSGMVGGIPMPSPGGGARAYMDSPAPPELSAAMPMPASVASGPPPPAPPPQAATPTSSTAPVATQPRGGEGQSVDGPGDGPVDYTKIPGDLDKEVRGARRGRRAPADDHQPRRNVDADFAEGPAVGARDRNALVG
jgi:hypothetical protein